MAVTEGTIERIAEQIATGQPSAPLWLVLLTGVLGVFSALAFKSLWHLDTVAHEGAHALAAVLLRRQLNGVKLRPDRSGVTTHSGLPLPGQLIVVAFAGYVGSSLFGLLGAALLGADRVVAVLALGLVLLALLLFSLRNAFGFLVVLLCGFVLFLVITGHSLALQRVVAYLMVWFLLAVGMPRLLELSVMRRGLTKEKRRESGSDVDKLRTMTWIPGAVWLWLQFVVCLAVLVAGGRLLLM